MAQFRICRVHERHEREHFIVERRNWRGAWRPVKARGHTGRTYVLTFIDKAAAQDWIDEEKRAPVHECGEVQ
ncbi:hypothetical protein [Brevundimonas olei]|uniref:hypothetical protein n=1 Tax=Brevundimonas olei TaxID=657642 RepID=UPI0031D2967C